MKNDIKTVYLDIRGGQHESKADAAKANRLIAAASKVADDLECNLADLIGSAADGHNLIEYARAVVAIHGMKDGAK